MKKLFLGFLLSAISAIAFSQTIVGYVTLDSNGMPGKVRWDTSIVAPYSSNYFLNGNKAFQKFDSTVWRSLSATGTGISFNNLTGVFTGSAVTSVSGTTNRITSTGGATPVIDISASYVGQSSLTTTGTLTSGTLGTGYVIAGVTMTLSSDATGDIYYRNSSGILTRLAIGTAKQHLLGGTIPHWADTTVASAGGGAISALTAATATNTIDNLLYKQAWNWSTLAGDTALLINSASTAAASNAQAGFAVLMSGANGTSSQTTYGVIISNTHTGTTPTNVGLKVTASGATNNYAALFTGRVGIGVASPTSILDVSGTIKTDGGGTGISYNYGDGTAIRNSSSGAATGYFDFNSGANGGTLLMRGSTLNLAGVTNTTGAASTWTSVNSNYDGGYTVANYRAIVLNSDSTRFRLNDNGAQATKSRVLAMGAANAFLTDSANASALTGHPVTTSALLELHSYTKGFLPPVMTLTQRNAIPSPASGLKIYNITDSTTDTYTGRGWNQFGNKTIIQTGGGNASVGTATLSGGTVTVSTTAVTVNSKIFLTDATTGSLVNIGTPTVGTITAGTSFVINSSNALDASNVNWFIIN